jgi:type II secretory ATPase GspE/PulE/Tfp pilus assembly ATPase PilB-like protein
LLLMTERLEQLASEKAPREEIEREAREEGMLTMWEDGIEKVLSGLTSIEELARVCTN